MLDQVANFGASQHLEDTSAPTLSPQDKVHLESLDRKIAVVKDYINGLIHGYHTGLWMYGNGGLGKSLWHVRFCDCDGRPTVDWRRPRRRGHRSRFRPSVKR